MNRLQKVMVGTLFLAIGVLWTFAASGCNTVKGAGQDISTAADRTEQMFY
jgi:predicted small secreted protein